MSIVNIHKDFESKIAITALISRILVLFLAIFFTSNLYQSQHISFLNAFSQWDGQWYLRIMREGYHWSGPEIQANVAFFPLYPVLGVIINYILKNDTFSLFLLSNICFIFACIIFSKLILLYFDQKIAFRSVLYLCIFPISFVFSSVYTESLFFLLAVSSFYLMEKKKFRSSAVCAGLASLTRFSGVTLFPVLLLMFLSKNKKFNKDLFWLILSPLGLLIYVIYLQVKVGDGFAFYKDLAAWHIMTVPPWILIFENIKMLFTLSQTSPLFYTVLFDFLTIFLFLYLFYYSWNKLPKYLLFYFFLIFSLSLTKMWDPKYFYPAGSVSRYLLEAFPIFIPLAVIGKKSTINYVYLIIAILMQVRLAISFFSGKWVF